MGWLYISIIPKNTDTYKVYNTYTMYYSCCSVTKLCLTLCDPMDCSPPGSSFPCCLLQFAQICVH